MIIHHIPAGKAAVSSYMHLHGPELVCNVQNISHMP